jgi:anti-sigma B factor antagonist
MQIEEKRYDEIILLGPRGDLDAQGSQDLEQKLLSLLDGGARSLVIDFTHVDQLTGPGLRVLVMVAGNLEGVEGDLVLCSLNEQVSAVFEVSGLVDYFSFASSRQEAIEQLLSTQRPSKLSILALKLLTGGEEKWADRGPADDSGPRPRSGSQLFSQVAEILSSNDGSPPKRIDKGRTKKTKPTDADVEKKQD